MDGWTLFAIELAAFMGIAVALAIRVTRDLLSMHRKWPRATNRGGSWLPSVANMDTALEGGRSSGQILFDGDPGAEQQAFTEADV